MKHQVLFSLKNNEKVFINVVCCSHGLIQSICLYSVFDEDQSVSSCGWIGCPNSSLG